MQINHLPFPMPSRMEIARKEIFPSSSFNSLGERVRDNNPMKRTFSLTFKMLTEENARFLSALGEGEQVLFTFQDPGKGEITVSCFCTAFFSRLFRAGEKTVWEEVRITLEEV